MNKRFLFLFIAFFFLGGCILFLPTVYSFPFTPFSYTFNSAIGVSPPKLSFFSNTSLALINSNSYPINYSISGCDYLSLQRYGSILPYSISSLIVVDLFDFTSIQKVKTFNTSCTFFVTLYSSDLSYGVAIPVTTYVMLFDSALSASQSYSTEHSILSGFFISDLENNTLNRNDTFGLSSSSFLLFVIIGVFFLIALFIIIKYV